MKRIKYVLKASIFLIIIIIYKLLFIVKQIVKENCDLFALTKREKQCIVNVFEAIVLVNWEVKELMCKLWPAMLMFSTWGRTLPAVWDTSSC